MQNRTKDFKLLSNSWFIFSVITLIGFIFRIRIGSHVSFWTDEGQYLYAVSIRNIFQLRDYIIYNSSCDQPALMYLLVYVWKLVIGSTPAALKLIPALFSTASIFVSGALCLRVTQSKLISYSLAILIALSPTSIRYSYDLTPYAILSFIGPISFFLFIDLVKKGIRIPSLSLILVNILFLNLHYYAFFAVTAQMLIFFYIILRQKKYDELKNFFAASICFFLSAFIPMLMLFNPYFAHAFQDWIEINGESTYNVTLGNVGFFKFTSIAVQGIWALVIGWFLITRYEKKHSEQQFFIVSTAYYLLTLITIVVVQLFTWKFLGHHRYLLVLYPVLFFVLLICLDQFPNRKIKIGIIAALAILFSIDVIKTQPSINQDFESAFHYLHQQEKREPFVIFFMPQGVNKPLSYYYADYFKLNTQIFLDNMIIFRNNPAEMNPMVNAFKKNAVKNVYLIHYFTAGRQQLKDMMLQNMSPYFTVTEEKEFRDIHIYKMSLK